MADITANVNIDASIIEAEVSVSETVIGASATIAETVIETSTTVITNVIEASAVVVENVIQASVTISTGPVGETGPQGPPGSGSVVLQEAENKAGSTVTAGQAVAIHSPSGVGWVLASASAFGTRAYGLAAETKANGVSLSVQTGDVLELDDWTAATGSTSLPARSRWYLADDGGLTQTPAATGGRVTQFIGEAIAPQKMAIRIGPPITRS